MYYDLINAVSLQGQHSYTNLWLFNIHTTLNIKMDFCSK